MNRRHYAIVLVFSISLLTVALIPLSGQEGNSYNPWLDYDDNGIIDAYDLEALGQAYGTSGTPLNMPMTLAYDSGWIDIHDKQGQYFNVTPSFNLEASTWMPTVRGKVAADTPVHQKYWYGYEMPGWNKTYGGTGDDYFKSVVQTSDGGYALAGYTYSIGSYDSWLVKTDSAGIMLWNKTYGGASDDIARSVVQTVDGGFALAGCTKSYGAGGYDFWLVKTDWDGNVQWNKTRGGPNNDVAYSVVQTSDGGYALAGYTNSSANRYDFMLVKTDGDGNVQWWNIFGGASDDIAYSVVEMADWGFALAGYTMSYGAGSYDFMLVKTTIDGLGEWSKTYGGPNNDMAYSMVQTADKGFALAGYTMSYGAGGYDFWLVKTDWDGNVQWNKTYGGTRDDCGESVVQTSDGGYALAGYTYSYANGYDFMLVKTTIDGLGEWSKTYGGPNNDMAYSIVQTSDKGFALAGYTMSYGAGGYDFWLVKTDAFGLRDLDAGVTITSITADAVTFYRGKIDPYYNYIRVRIWVVKEIP